MSEIRKGDMVRLVFACCALGRSHIGWTGVVERIANTKNCPCYCGYTTQGPHARVSLLSGGYVPLSWLIKIDPDALRDDVSETVPVTTEHGKRNKVEVE